MTYQSFGTMLRLLREDRRIGLREAARALGISHTHLIHVENGGGTSNGRGNLSIELAERVANVYGVDFSFNLDAGWRATWRTS